MDSLSFTFLLYASYCMALLFVLPIQHNADRSARLVQLRLDPVVRTSWPVVLLTTLLYVVIDVVIDPVALRGDRWFLGQIYGYTYPGLYFGVPLKNFAGWALVGLLALSGYCVADRTLLPWPDAVPSDASVTNTMLLGCGLYYGVLMFNLAVTFWIGESLLALTGLFIYVPITAFALLRLLNKFPAGHPSMDHAILNSDSPSTLLKRYTDSTTRS